MERYYQHTVSTVGDRIATPEGKRRYVRALFATIAARYDLITSIDEIARVLKPGGQGLSLDFDRPSNALVRSVYLLYLTTVGSALGWLLHRDPDTYRYIPASIRRYPGAAAVARLMKARGF